MGRFLLVCLGGAIGTGVRYLITGWVPRHVGTPFPLGTLVVNVLGSFVMGAVMTLALATAAVRPQVRLFLTTGILGGFTTYSTFNYEALSLLNERAWFLAVLDVAATLVGCLAFGALGVALGKALTGH